MKGRLLGCLLAAACTLIAACVAPEETVAGSDTHKAVDERTVCVGHHEMRLPVAADVRISATYVGLSVRDQGPAEWSEIESSLRTQAQEAEARPSPGDQDARRLYRAAGIDPELAFADSGLVGFDVFDEQAVIAEHAKSTSGFTIEAHRLYEGRHFVFQGKSNQASKYVSVRDGVLDAVARFTPLAEGKVPESDGFCTGNGVFALRDRNDIGGDAQLYVTFPAYPGLSFSLSLYGLVERSEEPSFIERVGRGLVDLVLFGGKVRTLHRGSRKYAGQEGRLVAISMRSEDSGGGRAYKYFWHADGEPLDPFRPEIEAELMTDTDGSEVDADTIEVLWRQIMGSLRARNQPHG